MKGELAQRVAVAAIGVPVAVAILYLGDCVVTVTMMVLAALGTDELFDLAAHRGTQPFRWLGIALAMLFVLAAGTDPAGLWTPRLIAGIVVAVSLLSAAAAIWRRGVDGAPLGTAAVTVFGAIFVGGALAHVPLLRQLIPAEAGRGFTGAALVAFPITLAWIGDTCAYFGGRAFGRRKLIPSVSPAKTVEGAVSGLIGTVLIGAAFAWGIFGLWLDVPIGPVAGAIAGLLVSPVAQIGDLAESLFKREARVKDSGRLLPGHGGVLDRFDSLFFAIPTVYWFLVLFLPFFVDGLPWR